VIFFFPFNFLRVKREKMSCTREKPIMLDMHLSLNLVDHELEMTNSRANPVVLDVVEKKIDGHNMLHIKGVFPLDDASCRKDAAIGDNGFFIILQNAFWTGKVLKKSSLGSSFVISAERVSAHDKDWSMSVPFMMTPHLYLPSNGTATVTFKKIGPVYYFSEITIDIRKEVYASFGKKMRDMGLLSVAQIIEKDCE
jgi:hypothetical protein